MLTFQRWLNRNAEGKAVEEEAAKKLKYSWSYPYAIIIAVLVSAIAFRSIDFILSVDAGS